MKNLLNFFFSFDKLFKEKLIVPFFWLAIIVWGLAFFESFLAGINLGPLAFIVKIIGNIITIQSLCGDKICSRECRRYDRDRASESEICDGVG